MSELRQVTDYKMNILYFYMLAINTEIKNIIPFVITQKRDPKILRCKPRKTCTKFLWQKLQNADERNKEMI